MVQNSFYSSWKLDDEPNLLPKVTLEAPQHQGREGGRTCMGFIVPEESSSPSTTNQIINQQSDYCGLFQRHGKTNKWLESKRKQGLSSSLTLHKRAMNHLGKGFIISRCHLGRNRGFQLCAGWLISEIHKAKKNRAVTAFRNYWWELIPIMGTFA